MLLDEFKSPTLGRLKNRTVMSAMTRGFAKDHHCTQDICKYYTRRAESGIGTIITEGIIIHQSGDGYNNVPHIETISQAESWAETISSVHNHDTKIIAQLWHCGRISHEDYTGGITPVSSSNLQAEGVNRQNNKPFAIPRKLDSNEMATIVSMYQNAAEKALKVGFDMVEVHMGHGYLIDQFFDSRINNRTDSYGGSVENRCRLALEILHKLVQEFGAEKITLRISPSRFMGGLYEWPDLNEMLEYLVNSIKSLNINLIDVSCANADFYQTSGKVIKAIRKMGYLGEIMGGASLSPDQADNLLNIGDLDLVTWGRAILANHDFVERISKGDDLIEMTDEMRSTLF